jgi:TetR/AcrR family transcriptional regulator
MGHPSIVPNGLTTLYPLPYISRMSIGHERRSSARIARRRRIQEVAREVFARQGFASSVEQIARTAQLSVGSIYLHFRSKDDLCVSLIEDALTRFDVEISELRLHATAEQRLRTSWELLIGGVHDGESARVLRLLAEPGIRSQLSDEVLAAVSHGTHRIKEHLANCIADGVASGKYRPVDAAEVAELLWSVLLGCLGACGIQASLGEAEKPLAARARKGFELIERALLVDAARAVA